MNRTIYTRVCLSLLLILSIGCNDDSGNTTAQNNTNSEHVVQVRVVNARNLQPIVGADVIVRGDTSLSGTTDSLGIFWLIVHAGTYSISASSAIFDENSITLKVENTLHRVELALTAKRFDILHASALIAYYPFTNNTKDSSENQLHGNASDVTSVTGKNNQPKSAYYFNGPKSYVRIPAHPRLDMPKNFTIAALIKPDVNYGTQSYGHIDIVGRWGTGGARNASYLLSLSPSAQPQFWTYAYNGAAQTSQVHSDAVLKPDYWVWIVAVKEDGLLKIYRDGKLIAQVRGDVDAQASDFDLYMGIGQDMICNYKGAIDEVVIVGRALTQEEIEALSEL